MSTTKLEERSYRPWSAHPKSQGLRSPDWRSEILQALLWLRGEGLGDDVDPALLERFLGVGARLDVQDLACLAGEGLLEGAGARYRLSEAGDRKARREFAAAFEEFTKPIAAECSRAAWCALLDV